MDFKNRVRWLSPIYYTRVQSEKLAHKPREPIENAVTRLSRISLVTRLSRISPDLPCIRSFPPVYPGARSVPFSASPSVLAIGCGGVGA